MFEKRLSVIALGCGGGVPMTYPGIRLLTGNTNFALVYHRPDDHSDFLQRLHDNPFWLIDCGPETVALLTEYDLFKQLQGVILTHVHADHSGGLASLAYRMMFVERRKIPLYFHKDLEPLLEQQLVELKYLNTKTAALTGKAPSSIGTFFTLPNPSDLWESTLEKWPFRVNPFAVSHNIENFPCFGIEINVEDGTRYVFSGDTAYPLPSPYIENATFVFHDVQTYNPGDGYEVHCPYQKLQDAVPPEHRHKVVLCHTPKEKRFYEDGFQYAYRGVIVTPQ